MCPGCGAQSYSTWNFLRPGIRPGLQLSRDLATLTTQGFRRGMSFGHVKALRLGSIPACGWEGLQRRSFMELWEVVHRFRTV